MDKTFYITTPIYYPSGNWHIGTCYTTVVCDAIARFKRMDGFDVFFLTGTDEHGQKIEEKAKAEGKTPMEFINPIVDDLKSIWKMLDISYDRFIRTTDLDHVKAVQKIFRQLYEKGEIYKSQYEGWYCTPCESFWTEGQLKEGKCPDCGREVHLEKEESYFFRLSKYADRLRKLFNDNPEFLQPKSRVNEMINNFIDKGLQDLCVSRTSIKWGIPVDFDPEHVVYVWVDALPNYISALGYGSDNHELFDKFWPCDLHMTGKEIIRFHTLVWPAILMALDIDIPKRVYGHGWLLIGGDKLSKSKGDKVKTELTDPKEIVARYGSDCLRYFLLREIPFGSDGVYTNESMLTRINSDLANDLGNLVSRTTAMINQYFGGVLPEPKERVGVDNELIAMAENLYSECRTAIDAINVPKALQEIFKLVSRANKYIDETMPWILAKDASMRERLGTVLYNLSECIRLSSVMLLPFIPETPIKILALYGIEADKVNFENSAKFGCLQSGINVIKSQPLFPRIDVKKEIEEIEKMMIKRNKEKMVQTADAKEKSVNKSINGANDNQNSEKTDMISIDDFAKLDLRVARVIDCVEVENSNKLLKFTLSLGGETRTVLSGIRKYYDAKSLVGKNVVMIANLPYRKLAGIESQGMILCAEKDGELSLLSTMASVPDGAKIS
ncbi:MAG: methionine--tRNA ligase [Christensenellaceae bacterium]